MFAASLHEEFTKCFYNEAVIKKQERNSLSFVTQMFRQIQLEEFFLV